MCSRRKVFDRDLRIDSVLESLHNRCRLRFYSCSVILLRKTTIAPHMRYAAIAIICFIPIAAIGQAQEEKRRAAYRARMERLFAIEERIVKTRPQRRDSPLRQENIRDDEVRQIQAAASLVVPKAIINISAVVTGCPCEEGPSCSDQVWILAHQSERTTGLQLSKISGQWTIGAVQRWWLEYEKLEARRASFRPISTYFHAEDSLKEQFPACLSSSEASVEANGTPSR